MNSKIWCTSILACVLVVAGCSGETEEKGPSGDGQQELRNASRSGESLGVLVDEIVADVAALPRSEFDVAALANRLGNDPQAHFDWVRDNTWWAPYRGLLRGPTGVLLDRVGSSLDRAVLLGTLLRHSGHTVRLRHLQLSEARARELLSKLPPTPSTRRADVSFAQDLDEESKRQIAESEPVREAASALVRSQGDALLAAVREATAPNASDEGEAIASAIDHWWIEREQGGKWTSMDLLTPEVGAGAGTETVVEWPAESSWPAIAEAEWHTVDIRVVVERYEAGATSESVLLETRRRPAEDIELPITLGHVPTPWPEDAAISPDIGALRSAALAARLWVPYLRVGDDVIAQSGFGIYGDLETDPFEATDLLDTTEPAGGIADAFGGFGAGEPTRAATAEWLDYEIRVPGAAPRHVRRTVFDLLGPSRRANKAADFDGTADLRKLERFEALSGYTDILLQPSEFTDEFVADLLASGIVANQAAIHELEQTSDPAKARQLASELLAKINLWGPLPNLVLWRSALAPSADTIVDAPNVLNYRANQRLLGTDTPTLHSLIDIAFNAAGTRRGANTDPFEIRLRQGVADTVAEMLALDTDWQMAENTASIFSRLAAEESRGMVIKARDVTAAGALPWPEDERFRVMADVGDGFAVVVPRKAVLVDGVERVGWWRVHPSSGETVGVMDNGFHAAATEDTLNRARAALRFIQRVERRNRGFMRQVVHNPTLFPNKEVQLYRRIFRLLREVEALGGL